MLTHFSSQFFIPQQVQTKQREIVRLQTEMSVGEDRVHAMSEHMKNVQQELNQTQVLINGSSKS